MLRLILFAALLIVPAVIAFYVGYGLGKRNGTSLSTDKRKELANLRELRTTLFRMSAQHSALGDPFATQVADEIQTSIQKES